MCLHLPRLELILALANADVATVLEETDLPAGVWSVCPHGQLRHPMLTAALQLDELAQVSPLCQWPDGYSAGVVECVLALRREREIERERSRPQ